MKFIFLLIIIALIVSLLRKKKPAADASAPAAQSDDYVIYSIKADGVEDHKKVIIDKLLVVSDLYESSKAQLVEDGYINEDIPKYEAKVRDVEFVPESEDSMKILIDGIHVGFVPSKNMTRVKNMLEKNDPEITWTLTGGPYKSVSEEYDYEKEKKVYTVDKVDTPIGIKITFKYRK